MKELFNNPLSNVETAIHTPPWNLLENGCSSSLEEECVLAVVGVYTKEDAGMLQNTLDAILKEIEIYAAD